MLFIWSIRIPSMQRANTDQCWAEAQDRPLLRSRNGSSRRRSTAIPRQREILMVVNLDTDRSQMAELMYAFDVVHW